MEVVSGGKTSAESSNENLKKDVTGVKSATPLKTSKKSSSENKKEKEAVKKISDKPAAESTKSETTTTKKSANINSEKKPSSTSLKSTNKSNQPEVVIKSESEVKIIKKEIVENVANESHMDINAIERKRIKAFLNLFLLKLKLQYHQLFLLNKNRI
jgi:hypothetical protein